MSDSIIGCAAAMSWPKNGAHRVAGVGVVVGRRRGGGVGGQGAGERLEQRPVGVGGAGAPTSPGSPARRQRPAGDRRRAARSPGRRAARPPGPAARAAIRSSGSGFGSDAPLGGELDGEGTGLVPLEAALALQHPRQVAEQRRDSPPPSSPKGSDPDIRGIVRRCRIRRRRGDRRHPCRRRPRGPARAPASAPDASLALGRRRRSASLDLKRALHGVDTVVHLASATTEPLEATRAGPRRRRRRRRPPPRRRHQRPRLRRLADEPGAAHRGRAAAPEPRLRAGGRPRRGRAAGRRCGATTTPARPSPCCGRRRRWPRATPGWLAPMLAAVRGVPVGEDDPPGQFVHLDDLAARGRRRRRAAASTAPSTSRPRLDRRRGAAGAAGRPPAAAARAASPSGWRRGGGGPGMSPTPPGLLPWTCHPWVVASDRLRAAGLGAGAHQRGGLRRRPPRRRRGRRCRPAAARSSPSARRPSPLGVAVGVAVAAAAGSAAGAADRRARGVRRGRRRSRRRRRRGGARRSTASPGSWPPQGDDEVGHRRRPASPSTATTTSPATMPGGGRRAAGRRRSTTRTPPISASPGSDASVGVEVGALDAEPRPAHGAVDEELLGDRRGRPRSGMAKPRPSAPACAERGGEPDDDAGAVAQRRRRTSPAAIGASVWIMSCSTSAVGGDPPAEPAHDADGHRRPPARPSGEPMATAVSPTSSSSADPDRGRPRRRRRGASSSTATTAMSVSAVGADDLARARRCRRRARPSRRRRRRRRGRW